MSFSSEGPCEGSDSLYNNVKTDSNYIIKAAIQRHVLPELYGTN